MTDRDISTWWPRLSIAARHDLNEALDGEQHPVIPNSVRGEIEAITGTTREPDDRVSDDERAFIETQQEQVD